MEWLEDLHRQTIKQKDYASKTLAAYKLGMKAGGSIVGVRVQIDSDCCELARSLPDNLIYHPDDAPILPLESCPLDQNCKCIYRPVMDYEVRDTK